MKYPKSKKKCLCVELLCIALTLICYNLLAVSMTSLEAIKKGATIHFCDPYHVTSNLIYMKRHFKHFENLTLI